MNLQNFEIVSEATELSRMAAELLVKFADEAIAEQGQFTVALSGGSTPKKLYELLATDLYRKQIEWQKIQFFFGDERNVPPDSDESNFRMVNQALFEKVSELSPNNIHRIAGEKSAADAASDYEQELKDFWQNELPRFDLILLGMGTDGHTASLFPESAALDENVRFFVENWVDKFESYRLTLTFPVINNARHVLFLIAGADKATVLREVLRGAEKRKYPSQLVNPINGSLNWLLDRAAAREMV